MVDVTRAVRAKMGEVVAASRLPAILGGCCTLLPGALAGARDSLGSVGMAYMDGHLDLYDGQTSTTGEPADMPISVVCGHGPKAWSAEVGAPVVAPDSLVLLGPRDREEAASLGGGAARAAWHRHRAHAGTLQVRRPCRGRAGHP